MPPATDSGIHSTPRENIGQDVVIFLHFSTMRKRNFGIRSSVILAASLVASLAWAQEDATHLQNEGLRAYQSGEFEEARTFMKQAHEQQPLSPAILYNWGLAEYKLGHVGTGLALWRRALEYDPGFREAKKALEFAEAQLPRRITPSGAESGETPLLHRLRPLLVGFAQMDVLFAVTLASVVSFGVWFLRKRRRQRTTAPKSTGVYELNTGDDEPSLRADVFNFRSLSFLGVVLLLLSLCGFRLYDYFHPRALIVEKTSSAHSGPGEDYAELFEVTEAQEVVLSLIDSDWVQIETLSGRAGWVKKSATLQFSGREP